MKTKLDLYQAAAATAEKNRLVKTPLESASLILENFKALGVADCHYEEFTRLVADRTNTFNNLASTPLDPPVAPLPLEAAQ